MSQWKRQLLDVASELVTRGRAQRQERGAGQGSGPVPAERTDADEAGLAQKISCSDALELRQRFEKPLVRSHSSVSERPGNQPLRRRTWQPAEVSAGATAATRDRTGRGGALVHSPDHGTGGIDSGLCTAAGAVCSSGHRQVSGRLSGVFYRISTYAGPSQQLGVSCELEGQGQDGEKKSTLNHHDICRDSLHNAADLPLIRYRHRAKPAMPVAGLYDWTAGRKTRPSSRMSQEPP